MNCPRCGEDASSTICQIWGNTGAYYQCNECGLYINKDGTENEVMIQPEEVTT